MRPNYLADTAVVAPGRLSQVAGIFPNLAIRHDPNDALVAGAAFVGQIHPGRVCQALGH